MAIGSANCFIADDSLGLIALDVSDPTSPRPVGAVDTPGRARAVVVVGSYAYVADDIGGVQVIDADDPEEPTIVAAIDTPSEAEDVAVAGQYLYVADRLAGVVVVAISDPRSPALVGSAGISGRAWGIAVAGEFAFVAGREGGLQILPAQCGAATPTLDGAIQGEGVPRLLATPNPTRTGTRLRFDLRSPGGADVGVYDVAGHLVRELLSGPLSSGTHEVAWDGRNAREQAAASGTYYVRLKHLGSTITGRVTLTK